MIHKSTVSFVVFAALATLYGGVSAVTVAPISEKDSYYCPLDVEQELQYDNNGFVITKNIDNKFYVCYEKKLYTVDCMFTVNSLSNWFSEDRYNNVCVPTQESMDAIVGGKTLPAVVPPHGEDLYDKCPFYTYRRNQFKVPEVFRADRAFYICHRFRLHQVECVDLGDAGAPHMCLPTAKSLTKILGKPFRYRFLHGPKNIFLQ